MIEHDPLIAEYTHEQQRSRASSALQTLQKVASVVKPLMRQRAWRVGTLSEFFPPEHNLLGLNWNRGQKICLRLRYPGDPSQFLPFEDVVDTMLHELCHIVHGPHNEAFHALWDQLRDEHETLLRKGYTGEGFLSTGHKLGGSARATARMPMHEARRRARAAAEQRRTLSAGSGQKLGGAPVRRGEDIRRVIADAAQRRRDVTRGCASAGAGQTKEDRRRQIVEETTHNTKTKAEEDDANERAIMEAYIELVQEEERQKYGSGYVPPSQDNPLGSWGEVKTKSAEEVARAEIAAARPPDVPTHSKPAVQKADSDTKGHSIQKTGRGPPKTAAPFDDTWTCDICTLHNPPTFLVCDACGTERSFAGQAEFSAEAVHANGSAANHSESAKKSANFTPSHAIDREIKRTRSAQTLRKLTALQEAEKAKPLGWLCKNCGTFMESEWWTCAGCGTVKTSS